jgi:hypothetical protein
MGGYSYLSAQRSGSFGVTGIRPLSRTAENADIHGLIVLRQNLLSCLFLLTILFGKIQGETIARIKRLITTKKGHQDATSITKSFRKRKNSPKPPKSCTKIQKLFSLITLIQ